MNELDKIKIIEEIMELDDGSLSMKDELDTYEEWDSLAVLSFIAVMDSRFGKTIKTHDMKNVKTVEDICNLI